MIYYLTSYLILIELREFLSLLLFAVIFGLWTYVFVVYFRSHSNTPQIVSNQFRILTKETEYSDMVEKQIQPHTLNNGLPFVSVIVPVRNEEKYIQRCLLSLLDQDYPYFEVIVVDDNSTDDILKTIQKVKKRKGTLYYQEIEKRALLAIEEEEEEETKLKILSLKDKPEKLGRKNMGF